MINPYYESKDCKLFQFDNLELFKQLPDNYIDLIYCDILYGTGRNFGDYQDLKPDRRIIEEHYFPRLIEMKRILKDTGSVYLQMDTRINHWMRYLMDNVFGYDNFIDEIIWYYDNGGGRSKTWFNNKNDHIIVYSKIKNAYTYNPILVPYKKSSQYAKTGIVNNGKKYMPSKMGKNCDNVWLIPSLNPMSKERKGYETQKPKELIERIILASSNPDDIVADFYMGSGTTAESALSLGRKFIGCDIGDKACKITQERIEKFSVG